VQAEKERKRITKQQQKKNGGKEKRERTKGRIRK
jgi:hypothetical protein